MRPGWHMARKEGEGYRREGIEAQRGRPGERESRSEGEEFCETRDGLDEIKKSGGRNGGHGD